MGIIWALEAMQSIYLGSNFCAILFMHFCERKEASLHFLHKFYIEVVNINFWQIWHFEIMG